MGLTHLAIEIASPARPEEFRTERFLIDSGPRPWATCWIP